MAPAAVGSSQGHLSLRELVQQRLIDDVFQKSGEKWKGWMVLVVDPESLRVVSSALGMYDLMEQRITIVEDLTKKRAPFKEMSVIYLLEPKEESVDRLISDWTPSEHRKEPLYADAVFLYFLGKLPDHLFRKIKACKPLVKRVKSLGEVNADFLTKEARAFHFDMKRCFAELYLRRAGPTGQRADIVIADKLVTLCATLNEYPHVRFPAQSDLCRSLADVFQMKMNEFVGSNEKWWYYGDATHSDKERSTLLFLDRKDDCLSPLMHELTYEAMVKDLLPIEDDRITYVSETAGTAAESKGETQQMDALLNDNDEVWVDLRGKHIADVIQTLSNRIREIVSSSTGSALAGAGKGDSGKALSLSQMANALKALPEYREIMSKLSQHMHISHQCMEVFNRDGLLDLSDLEQTLATGKTEDGSTPKLSALVAQVEEELHGTRDAMMRLRLLAILIVSQGGIRPADRERLFAAAQLNPQGVQTLKNLEILDCPLIQTSTKKSVTSMFMGKRLVSSGRQDNESEYSSSRYMCSMKSILQDMEANRLSIEKYPSVMPLPENGSNTSAAASARARPTGSARKGGGASKWARPQEKKKAAKATFQGARQIVFMVGGMCYSELRAAREVMASGEKEFVVGATRFINPADFVEEVGILG